MHGVFKIYCSNNSGLFFFAFFVFFFDMISPIIKFYLIKGKFIFSLAILVIYLTSMLNMSKDDATAVYHAFNMLCYFSPIFGAIIADSFWGKYK